MLANDLKKGMRVMLRNGWEAEILDNKKGNILTAKVFGTYTEVGSVYAMDIAAVQIPDPLGPACWEAVTLSPTQVKAAQLINSWRF